MILVQRITIFIRRCLLSESTQSVLPVATATMQLASATVLLGTKAGDVVARLVLTSAAVMASACSTKRLMECSTRGSISTTVNSGIKRVHNNACATAVSLVLTAANVFALMAITQLHSVRRVLRTTFSWFTCQLITRTRTTFSPSKCATLSVELTPPALSMRTSVPPLGLATKCSTH